MGRQMNEWSLLAVHGPRALRTSRGILDHELGQVFNGRVLGRRLDNGIFEQHLTEGHDAVLDAQVGQCAVEAGPGVITRDTKSGQPFPTDTRMAHPWNVPFTNSSGRGMGRMVRTLSRRRESRASGDKVPRENH